MSLDELAGLADDIKKNGVRVPIVLWSEDEDGKRQLLDGRNRLDAAELAGIEVVEVRRDKGHRVDIRVPYRVLFGSGGGRNIIDGSSLTADPYEFVLSANVHRRHLSAEQKRELIGKLLKAQPGKSDRTIATQTKVSHVTVGAVRKELEGRGQIDHVEKRTDTRGRKQPAKRAPSRLADKEVANRPRIKQRDRPAVSGPDSAGEIARLEARIDELERELRRRELV
jgi:ParB/Sulfiredoxin domain